MVALIYGYVCRSTNFNQRGLRYKRVELYLGSLWWTCSNHSPGSITGCTFCRFHQSKHDRLPDCLGFAMEAIYSENLAAQSFLHFEPENNTTPKKSSLQIGFSQRCRSKPPNKVRQQTSPVKHVEQIGIPQTRVKLADVLKWVPPKKVSSPIMSSPIQSNPMQYKLA